MNPIPTKEELGLPWSNDSKEMDMQNVQNFTLAEFYWSKPLDFAIHAANTYHDRQALLRECLELLKNLQGTEPISRYAVEKAVERIKQTLTPPAAT